MKLQAKKVSAEFAEGGGWEHPPFLQPYREAPEEKTHRNMGMAFKCSKGGVGPSTISFQRVSQRE
jgi:hypothetical protein